MSLIGHVIGNLAQRTGGQALLELPDELSPSFVRRIVEGANEAFPQSPPFCLFVHDRRSDVEDVPNTVDSRELAMYRQGPHLAVVYASENRGMATYTSVYPMLLDPGFPGSDLGAMSSGLVGLRDFAKSIVACSGLGASRADHLDEVLEFLTSFLAEVYQLAGNGQSSISADWWTHIEVLVEALASLRTENSKEGLTPSIYGCAALPAPIDGTRLKMSPREYLAALMDRWQDPPTIRKELARLSALGTAAGGAERLSEIDWETSFASWSLKTDSLVTKIAMSGVDSSHKADRLEGWSSISEVDFLSSYRDAKNELAIEVDQEPLPRPWKSALPVLLVGEHDLDADDRIELSDVSIILPWKQQVEAPDLDLVQVSAGVQIRGLKAAEVEFQPIGFDFRPSGLALNGRLTLLAAAKSPWQLTLEAMVSGPLAELLADRSDCTIAILRPDEAFLQVRRTSKGGSGPKSAHALWTLDLGDAVTAKLGSQGDHELAIASTISANEAIKTSTAAVTFAEAWPDSSHKDGLWLARGSLAADLSISTDTKTLFEVTVAVEKGSPLSPITAAAEGGSPDYGRILEPCALGDLDQEVTQILGAIDGGGALGSLLRTTGRKHLTTEPSTGVSIDVELADRLGQVFPGPPSDNLLNHPSYQKLREAYQALGISDCIAHLEQTENTSGVTVSRISLEFIAGEKIDELLTAYADILENTEGMSPSDRFWARHPFSVAIYPDEIGSQSLVAVLLSPLHPIRLAWSRNVQVGLRAAFDDGADPRQSLPLLDPGAYPVIDVFEDDFGSPLQLVPVALNGSPGEVFAGWQAFVRVMGNKPVLPDRVNGWQFPVDGMSGLSSSAMSSAVDDFLRVSPHVQALRVELEAVSRTPRSRSIDQGLLSKIAQLVEASHSLDGVRGVRVVDSPNRVGQIPTFRDIAEALDRTKTRFNVEWTEYGSDDTPSHLTFLEGLAATLAAVPTAGDEWGWVPELPLRRFPYRTRTAGGGALNFALKDDDVGDPFKRALREFERLNGTSYELRVKPNLAALPRKPNWIVAGDFGVDPQSIAQVSLDQAGGRYMLWDWRPVSALNNSELSEAKRAQPYFIMAALPPALSSAISQRVSQLSPGVSPEDLEARGRLLVSTLSTRAVGLNTLLSVGHHQATGALGFFFALRSINKWMAAAPDRELRVVVPVDAVDPFLRGIPAEAPASRRRADLLALRGVNTEEGQTTITFVPIEIKHYGLNSSETESSFPGSDETRLLEHIDQLATYQKQLVGIRETYVDSNGSRSSVVGQQLAAVLEAALQLSPRGQTIEGAEALERIACGTAQVNVGKGVLLWFQAGATGVGGAKAEIEEIYGPLEKRRIDVRIDPKEYGDAYWSSDEAKEPSKADEAVIRALELATEEDDGIDLSPPEAGPPEPSPDDIDDDQRAPEKPETAPPTSIEAAPAPMTTDDPVIPQPATDLVEVGTPKRMDEGQLETIYKKLLAALAEFNVQVQRPKGTLPYREGPAFIEFAVHPAYGVSVSKIESQLENVKLRLGLHSDANIGCTNHLGNVLLTVPKKDEDRYFVSTKELWSRWLRPASGFHVPLGEDITGDVVSIEFSSPNSPHLLIAGVTGSGKSEALLTLLRGATAAYRPDELQLGMIDPKRTELASLERLPHNKSGTIGWSAEDAISILSEAADDMDARYELFRNHRVRDIDEYREKVGPLARTLIVLDEYADLTTEDDDRKAIEKLLKRLAQKARAAGIHVIISTQKPVVQVVNTVIKGNLPGRVALRVNTGAESRVILDENGAEQLVGKGDAILKVGNSRVRLQFARFDEA